MTHHEHKGNLTVIRGGVPDSVAPGRVLARKLELLRDLPPKKGLAFLLDDPDPMGLVAALEPQEFHLLITEIGLNDSALLLPLAQPEQVAHCLDRELWQQESYLPEAGVEWLLWLLSMGEERLAELLPHLDPELLTLILSHEITVGGGAGDLTSDDERIQEWDHSFDNIYMISFRHQKSGELVGRFIDQVFQADKDLYQWLMQGVKNELSSELEESAFQLRVGRMADLGFPARRDAITLYSVVDPAAFGSGEAKRPLGTERAPFVPSLFRHDESLLGQVLRRADSPDLLRELQYIITSALVVEDLENDDSERAEMVLLRVHGYLTIALEFLAGDDEDAALELVGKYYLKELFQVGYTLVRGLRRRATPFSSDDHATGSVLSGLRADFPKFYRGLDSNGADAFREFGDLEDIHTVEQFLAMLEG